MSNNNIFRGALFQLRECFKLHFGLGEDQRSKENPYLLESQLLYNHIDLIDSLTHNVTFIPVDHISVVVDLFGRSLWFCHLEFEQEAISEGQRSENGRYVVIFFSIPLPPPPKYPNSYNKSDGLESKVRILLSNAYLNIIFNIYFLSHSKINMYVKIWPQVIGRKNQEILLFLT